MLLGVDVGTTHCKAGLFRPDGTAVKIASRPTLARHADGGWAYFEPEELWQTVADALREAASASGSEPIAAVGIASMAETGLLLGKRTGAPRSFVVPWFETAAQPQADWIKAQADPLERFQRTGIRSSFKSGLAKILWLESLEPGITDNATWLSAADYIACRLTGQLGTDYSLATRTYAFRIDTREWDTEWLGRLGLPAGLFPPARLGGTPLGSVSHAVASSLGIAPGTRVAVAGHDHVCAALAAGATGPGVVFDSIGTAETLVGALAGRGLGKLEFESGLVYGCHVVQGTDYWMGGLSASGRSVEWLRGILGDPPLDYSALLALLEERDRVPGDILYFPYLLGNQSRAPAADARGALLGLTDKHTRADLALAVLEGTAYEMETIRRTAEQVNGIRIERLVAAGGGVRNPRWLQVKADVSGCEIEMLPAAEATLLGAALLAGIGAGVYANAAEAVAAACREGAQVFSPDPKRHVEYRERYEKEYVPFQQVINRPRR